MSYHYQTQRPRLFNEDGMKLVLYAIDEARKVCRVAGACTSTVASCAPVGAADGWDLLAVLDYLVEQGYLVWVARSGNTQVYLPGTRL